MLPEQQRPVRALCFTNAADPFTCSNGTLPNGAVAKRDWNFYELYAKGVWTINPQWALGANYYGTPNILNTGSPGNYVSGTVKYTAPDAWKIVERGRLVRVG